MAPGLTLPPLPVRTNLVSQNGALPMEGFLSVHLPRCSDDFLLSFATAHLDGSSVQLVAGSLLHLAPAWPLLDQRLCGPWRHVEHLDHLQSLSGACCKWRSSGTFILQISTSSNCHVRGPPDFCGATSLTTPVRICWDCPHQIGKRDIAKALQY